MDLQSTVTGLVGSLINEFGNISHVAEFRGNFGLVRLQLVKGPAMFFFVVPEHFQAPTNRSLEILRPIEEYLADKGYKIAGLRVTRDMSAFDVTYLFSFLLRYSLGKVEEIEIIEADNDSPDEIFFSANNQRWYMAFASKTDYQGDVVYSLETILAYAFLTLLELPENSITLIASQPVE